MKNNLAKIITVSSLILIVSLYTNYIFSDGKNKNDMVFNVKNTNLSKMDDNTSLLFEEKEEIVALEEKTTYEEQPVVDESKEEVINIVENLTETVIEEKKDEEVTYEEPHVEEEVTTTLSEEREVLQTVVGNLTGYGADCVGCSGITSSGFDLTKSIYYEDSEFGTVRILAADPSFPFYSIFRVSNVPTMDDFIGIVLDRGGNVGFGRGTLFDLAYFSESDPNLVPLTRNVTFELLRSGR